MKITKYILQLVVILHCIVMSLSVYAQTDRYNSKNFTKGVADSLSIKNTSIHVGEKVLMHNAEISISALDSIDVPAMDYGMFNVSIQGEGYRFLPHGTHFNENGATVSLKYDRTRIPSGYTEDDIHTFYYDMERKCWIALQRISVDKHNSSVISKTTHFTDMINGIIATPETPETNAFVPTMMNDIEAALPTSKINIIMPPTANNRGSANLQYFFEIPPARNGMQPQVGLFYNSDCSSGWAGEGWDIFIPTISIDTRWGVPHYNDSIETETYLLNGQMLAMMEGDEMTVAHRQDSIPRKTDRQFFLRQGGDFSKIIRRGTSPTNYYWEITDRNGVVYIYGDSSMNDVNGELRGTYLDVQGVSKNVVAEWKLTRMTETHGDYCNYIYTNATENISDDLNASALYLCKIEVGNAEAQVAHTEIQFVNCPNEKNIRQNSARYGFFSSNNKLLDSVKVLYRNIELRSYKLSYTQGAFRKKLLSGIVHRDNQGNEMQRQSFDYYSDVTNSSGQLTLFSNSRENWTSVENIETGGFNKDIQAYYDHSSTCTAMGGTKTKSMSATIYTGVGSAIGSGKALSAGVSFGYAQSTAIGELSLIDIDGDGLADKVYSQNDTLYYCKQITGNDGKSCFERKIKLNTEGSDIKTFSRSKSSTTTIGGKGYAGLGPAFVEVGADIMSCTTKTTHYFADVNNDGLPDIVANGKVYFNHIDNNGVPSFSLSSNDTPSPIINTGEIETFGLSTLQEPQDTLIKYSPMQDVVRYWEAPNNGTYSINALAKLLVPTDASNNDDFMYADGVYLSIQRDNTIIWSQQIEKSDSSIYNYIDTLEFNRGERIYFRTQCGRSESSNGDFDKVVWKIGITKNSHTGTTQIDANGYELYNYSTSDSTFSSALGIFPVNTNVTITGNFVKPITTDSVSVHILYFDNEDIQSNLDIIPDTVFSQTFPMPAVQTSLNPVIPNVCNNGTLKFVVTSQSNVAWDAIRWTPIIHVPDTTNSQSHAITEIPVDVAFVKYGETVLEGEPYCPRGGTRNYYYWRNIKAKNNVTGVLTQTIKADGELISKDKVYVINGKEESSDLSHSVVLEGNKRIWVEYFTDDTLLAKNIEEAQIFIQYPNRNYAPTETVITPQRPDTTAIPVDVIYANLYTVEKSGNLGAKNHSWGQFVYNAYGDRFCNNIKTDELHLPTDSAGCNPLFVSISHLKPQNGNTSLLVGAKNDIFIHGDTIGVARLGENNVIPEQFIEQNIISEQSGGRIQGTAARALTLISKSKSNDIIAGVGLGVQLSKNKAYGTEVTKNAFWDMNGDGFPDIITEKTIQYTNPLGGFTRGNTLYRNSLNLEEQEKEMLSNNNSSSIGFGGEAIHSYSSNKQNGTSNISNDNAKVAGNFSVSCPENHSSSKFSYIDINGDGLPDMVSVTENNSVSVRYNLGYNFSQPITLAFNCIRKSEAKTKSASLGGSYNISASSFAAGFGLSTTTSMDNALFADINGDGLPDWIEIASNEIIVYLNVGNNFVQTPIQWGEINELSNNSATSLSENVAFTYRIPIPFIPVSIVLSSAIYSSQGVSREEKGLRDITGDGFPDFITSDNQDVLKVNRSNIRRTNKLKTVTNSLGGKFTLDYKHNTPTYGLPGGKWVMSSVEVDYGIHFDGMSIPNTKTFFEYENGVRDRHEREFLGFGIVKTIQSNTDN